MFITNMLSISKLKAERIQFSAKGNVVGSDLQAIYNKLKLTFARIEDTLEKESDSYNSILICKEMLKFYNLTHELLQNILTECFKDDFYAEIEQMEPFFIFLNKVFKIMIAFDLLKLKNPQIFSIYCEAKLLDDKTFCLNIEDNEDSKICTFNLVSLPLGRLFLSFFSYPSFDLEQPLHLSKAIKIYLNADSIKRVSVFIYVVEKYKWKYITVFFVALYYRLSNNTPFSTLDGGIDDYKGYLDMLKRHC